MYINALLLTVHVYKCNHNIPMGHSREQTIIVFRVWEGPHTQKKKLTATGDYTV